LALDMLISDDLFKYIFFCVKVTFSLNKSTPT